MPNRGNKDRLNSATAANRSQAGSRGSGYGGRAMSRGSGFGLNNSNYSGYED